LNLITDSWIPVHRDGAPDIIRPDQIAEAGVMRLDWPRPDLNLACMELLVGLLFLADPPVDVTDWTTRPPDAERLRRRLAPFTPAFNLTGDGPLFMQDFEELEGNPNPLDMLFIDSSGSNTAKHNADLMVRRGRYLALSLPLAAMALYTLQAFAPSGGAGNRTSMRGGGPLVTLVIPQEGGAAPLWSMLWANVPIIDPQEAWQPDEMAEILPWMRPTRTSEKGQVTAPFHNVLSPEIFFGMPRRLRLVFGEGHCVITGDEGEVATGVIQRPYGANYQGWVHCLTPYYYDAKKQKLPKHPKPGTFGYPNWLGVLFNTENADRATCIQNFQQDFKAPAHVLVGGWAMDNMKPLDFIWSEAPLFLLSEGAEDFAVHFVMAAQDAAKCLTDCLKKCLTEDDGYKGTVARVRETFFEQSQAGFETALAALANGEDAQATAENWRQVLQSTALGLFDRHALGQLLGSDMDKTEIIVNARQKLVWAFQGHSRFGKKIFTLLDLPLPVKRKKENAL
jgi:CRISPR system Cascade subunit CasA